MGQLVPARNLAEQLELARQAAREAIDRLDSNARALLAVIDRIDQGRVFAPDYFWEPVSIHDFIYDGYYLPAPVANSLFPRIVNDLEELFAGDYTEVLLAGSIGWGKSSFCNVASAYDLYRVSCLRDPAATYGMIPGTPLTFLNVGPQLKQAKDVLFNNLFGLISESLYFRQNAPYNPKIKSEIQLVRNGRVIIRCRPAAATTRAQLGVAVFSAAIDEANFYDKVKNSRRTRPGEPSFFDQAQAIANVLLERLRNRMNQRGRLPGKLYYISSAGFPDDFTERKKAQAKNDRTIFVREYSSWETKISHPQEREKITRNPDGTIKTFPVELGDVTKRPRVLPEDRANWPLDVDRGNVVEVSVDFRKDFESDIERAVRNVMGRSTLSVTPFITRRDMIWRMFELGESAGLRHPFSRVDERGYPLDVTLQGRTGECEYFLPEYFHWAEKQKLDALGRPMYYEEAPMVAQIERYLYPALRYAANDLAKNRSAAAICIGHVVGSKQVQRVNPKTGNPSFEKLPLIQVDLILRVVNPPHGEIDIARIRGLYYELRDKYGMQFGLITYDRYQSQESVKNLRDNGFTAEEFSVDRDYTAYDMLRQAIYDERVISYRHPVLAEELARLERGEKKVEKPANGSKDVADTLAAVVHHCQLGWSKAEGATGLFQF